MAIDPSIPLQAGQGVQPQQNPLTTLGQYAGTANALAQNKLINQQALLQQQELAQQQQNMATQAQNRVAQQTAWRLPQSARPQARQMHARRLLLGSVRGMRGRIFHQAAGGEPPMSNRKFDKRPPRPKPIGPATPEGWDRMNNAIIGVDEAWRKVDAKWGVGRLVCLVSDDTRERMRRGMDQWQAAMASGDDAKVVELAPKVRGALAFMDAEATATGEAPLAPEVWEARLEDGTVLAIVRSNADAHAVAASGRKVTVWTVDEIARVLPSSAHDVKNVFPGAKVERVTTHDEGFALDWTTSDPMIADLWPEAVD